LSDPEFFNWIFIQEVGKNMRRAIAFTLRSKELDRIAKELKEEFKNASEVFYNKMNDAGNKLLTAEMEELISHDDFKQILSYVQNHAVEIIAKVLEKKEKGIISDDENIWIAEDGNDLIVSVSIPSSKKNLPRTFVITYNKKNKSFTVKIYLNRKTSEIDPLTKKYKKGPAVKGSDNKFARLLMVEFSKNNPDSKISIVETGRVVHQDNHSSNEELIRKAKLQAALAALNICLPVTILPAGKKGKLSLEVPYAEDLVTFNSRKHTPKEMQQICKDIIEKVELLRKMGMVHGDLKQENILIRNGRAYIADLDTLGFVDDVHAPQGTFRYLTPCALLSMFKDRIVLEDNVLPIEVRKAMTYSPSSDLYAVANLISRTSQSNNPDGGNDDFSKIDEILLPYLDPTNDSYTIFHELVDRSVRSLSLHDLYNKIFNEDLEVPVDKAKEDAAKKALQEYVAPRVQSLRRDRCIWAFSNVKGNRYNQEPSLIRNIILSNNELDEKIKGNNVGETELKKIPVNASVERLIGVLNGSGGYEYKIDACRKYLLDLDENLLLTEEMSKHFEFLDNFNTTVTMLDVYKDKLLLMLQIISLIIIQRQLTNVELISANKAGSSDLPKLRQIEKIFVSMIENAKLAQDRLVMIQKNKNEKVSTGIHLEAEKHMYLKYGLTNTIDIDEIFAKTFQHDDQKATANEYLYSINRFGFAFSKISMSTFKKLSIDEQQQLINYTETHRDNLMYIRGVYAKGENSTDQITLMNAINLKKLLNVHIDTIDVKLEKMERIMSLALRAQRPHI
jgi:serine/threonine protein kinase